MSATLHNFDSPSVLGRELERQAQEIEILRKVAEAASRWVDGVNEYKDVFHPFLETSVAIAELEAFDEEA